MNLTNSEEQIMKILWKLEKAFIRDILSDFPEPKPAPTTVLTLLRRMIDKGFVNYRQCGNSREYYPVVKKSEYFSNHLHVLIRDFFNNSTAQFSSFFTNETNLTEEELKELREMVNRKLSIKRKNK
jgi:predicted transcriptional regulator